MLPRSRFLRLLHIFLMPRASQIILCIGLLASLSVGGERDKIIMIEANKTVKMVTGKLKIRLPDKAPDLVKMEVVLWKKKDEEEGEHRSGN